MKKISILLNIIFIIILVLIFLMYPSKRYIAIVSIRNNANQTISELSVSLDRYPTVFEIKRLEAGGSAKIEFSDFGDTEYIIKGKLSDGTQINSRVGYLTSGTNFSDEIIILKGDKVELNQKMK